jgi:hypothetical protein
MLSVAALSACLLALWAASHIVPTARDERPMAAMVMPLPPPADLAAMTEAGGETVEMPGESDAAFRHLAGDGQQSDPSENQFACQLAKGCLP